MRFPRALAIFTFMLTGLLSLPVSAQDQVVIAVLDLTGQGVTEGELQTLSERLRIEMFKTGRFRVMERAQMDAVLEEQGFQQTDCVATECVVEVGRLVGVSKMVAGNVGKIGRVYTITARIIDVESGELEATAVQDCQCPLENVLTTQMALVAGQLSGAQAPRRVLVPRDPEPSTAPTPEPEPAPAPEPDRPRSVSYTHLTLPTN